MVMMTTTNHYQPPFTLLPIKPPPWRDRHLPPASLYRLPITHILLLFSNTSSSLRLNHIVLHPIHFRLNLRYPKSTAFGRHRPHLLHKNYYFHPTPSINLLPHSPLPPPDASLPLPTTPTTFSGSHGLTQTSLHHLTTSSYVTYLTKVPTHTLFFPHHLQFRSLLKDLPTHHPPHQISVRTSYRVSRKI